MTLLTIIQDAADRVGITSPSSVIGSTDQQVIQLLSLANKEGKELARKNWQVLLREKTFTATATEEQASAIPSDFDRFLPDTFFNRSRNRQVIGGLTAQEWQHQKSISGATSFDAFRIRGGDFLIMPTPSAGDIYAYEYFTKNWCASDTGDEQARFEADTDTTLLDEELIILGVEWRFKHQKGLDFQQDYLTYERQVMAALARDGVKRGITFGASRVFTGIEAPQGDWDL